MHAEAIRLFLTLPDTREDKSGKILTEQYLDSTGSIRIRERKLGEDAFYRSLHNTELGRTLLELPELNEWGNRRLCLLSSLLDDPMLDPTMIGDLLSDETRRKRHFAPFRASLLAVLGKTEKTFGPRDEVLCRKIFRLFPKRSDALFHLLDKQTIRDGPP
jgi:hypothetical protein